MGCLLVPSQYITEQQFMGVLRPLNVNLGDDDLQDLLDRAVADLEGELVLRYNVPLLAASGAAYSSAQAYSTNMVITALKAKIRSLVGVDKNRNVIVEQGQRYIDLHEKEFANRIKLLLDPKRTFDFQLNPQAVDSIVPIEHVGIARASDRPQRVPDFDAL